MVTIMQTRMGPRGYFLDASVDPTEARKHAGLGPADRVVRRGGNRARMSCELRPRHRTDQPAAVMVQRLPRPGDSPLAKFLLPGL
jgi:hypothetical protein